MQTRHCKKKKVEKQKWLVEKRKKQHEICQTSKRKKYYQDHNFECSQTNKSQVKSTYDNTQIDSNKSLCKKQIQNKNKLEKQKWPAENTKNEHDISLNSKRKKYNLGHNYKSSERKKIHMRKYN